MNQLLAAEMCQVNGGLSTNKLRFLAKVEVAAICSPIFLSVNCYPDLLDNIDIKFIRRSATAGINVRSDAYFDNDTVLAQFERLFKMIKFKANFTGHEVEIVVDNARTHMAKDYSVNDFGKGIGTRCSVKSIDYLDADGKVNQVSCYFEVGKNKGKSKGLLTLAKELGFKVTEQCKLNELQAILTGHLALQGVSNRSFHHAPTLLS